jgi:hypothetical protein
VVDASVKVPVKKRQSSQVTRKPHFINFEPKSSTASFSSLSELKNSTAMTTKFWFHPKSGLTAGDILELLQIKNDEHFAYTLAESSSVANIIVLNDKLDLSLESYNEAKQHVVGLLWVGHVLMEKQPIEPTRRYIAKYMQDFRSWGGNSFFTTDTKVSMKETRPNQPVLAKALTTTNCL